MVEFFAVAIGLYIAYAVWLEKHQKPEKKDKTQEEGGGDAAVADLLDCTADPDSLALLRTQANLDYARGIAAKIRELEDMLTDIDACKDGRTGKSFFCKWQTTGGIEKRVDLWADDSGEDTEELRQLIVCKRDRLRRSLLHSIESLYTERSHEISHENAEPDEGGGDPVTWLT